MGKEMCNLSSKLKLGDEVNVELPFTAPCDGFLYTTYNVIENTTTYLYLMKSTGDDNHKFIKLCSVNGAQSSTLDVLKKGCLVSVYGSRNVQTIYCTFTPLC